MVTRSLCILALIGFSSCTADVNWKPVSYGYLLHDGNSKVWMVDQMVKDSADVGPFLRKDKDVLIFYYSGAFRYSALPKLGTNEGKKGTFFFDTEKKSLTLSFNGGEDWKYDFKTVTEDSIYIAPVKGGKTDVGLKLIPFPEIL